MISDVIVGPGNIIPVPAVGTFQPFTPQWVSGGTPTPVTVGTTSSYYAVYRQINDTMEIYISLVQTGAGTDGGAGTYYLKLPNNLTINSSVPTIGTGGGANVFGYGRISTGPSTNVQSLIPIPTTATGYTNNVIAFIFDASTAGSIWSTTSTPAFTTSNLRASFSITVPIAEWAGAPNYAGSNDVEYAFNSSSSTSTDTTSFGYGNTGVSIASFAPSGTTAIAKRVRFQTPIQDGDDIALQLLYEGKWQDVASTPFKFATNDAGSTFYGAYWIPISGNSTDIDVRFQSAAIVGTAWSSISVYRWRVVKARAGSAVGFGAATSTSMGLVKAVPLTTFSVAATGPINSSATFRASRSGDVVTLTWPQLLPSGVSSSTPITLDFSNMPSWARPAIGTLLFPVFTRDNGTYGSTPSQMSITTSGNGTINKTYASGEFTSNTGTTGFEGGTISYVGAAW